MYFVYDHLQPNHKLPIRYAASGYDSCGLVRSLGRARGLSCTLIRARDTVHARVIRPSANDHTPDSVLGVLRDNATVIIILDHLTYRCTFGDADRRGGRADDERCRSTSTCHTRPPNLPVHLSGALIGEGAGPTCGGGGSWYL